VISTTSDLRFGLFGEGAIPTNPAPLGPRSPKRNPRKQTFFGPRGHSLYTRML
jgi:hypothetical protein